MRRIVPHFLASVVLALPQTALAGDSDLDPTWGGNLANILGTTTTAIGTADDVAYGIAIQADGKIVAVGSTLVGNNPQFSVTRYNSDGTLDTAFGDPTTPGSAVIAFACTSAPFVARGVVIQPDGKIVVVGWGHDPTCSDFGTWWAIARLDSTGKLDTTFGGQAGNVPGTFAHQTEDGYRGEAYAVALQPAANSEGFKIVAAGNRDIEGHDFGLARYNPDGTLDTAFGGGDGLVATDTPGT